MHEEFGERGIIMSSFTKKILILFFVISFLPCVLFAQDQSPGIAAGNIGVTSAQQRLREISITKFEHQALFRAAISSDAGFITMRRLRGSPLGKTPLEDEALQGLQVTDDHVVGLRVDFLRRGVHSFTVVPVRPISIPGITKTLSVWVAGRNTNHMLTILLLDIHNRPQELTVGRLNFSGWRRLTVAVPPEIAQTNFRRPGLNGIHFAGFRVDCDLMETYGVFFVYFDDLRAVTDLFGEESRDIDDMMDAW
jgi:hypothetical protein